VTSQPSRTSQVCIYLESTASGQSLYNGPKPAEEVASFTPIDAAGNFSFVTWWANTMYDPIATAIYVVAVSNTYMGAFPGAMAGMCDPVLGVPVAPESLPIYDAATVWAKIPRVNNLMLTLDPITGSPLMSAATDVTGTIMGLSDVPSQFAVLLFRREVGGGLTGPLPGCTPAAASVLLAGAAPGTATFRVTGWAGAVGTPAYTLNTQAELVLLLVPSAVVPGPGDAVCVTDAGAGLAVDAVTFRLPAGVLGVRLGSVEVARPLVNPSASSSPTPTPSGSPSVSLSGPPSSSFAPLAGSSSGASGVGYEYLPHLVAACVVATGALMTRA